MAEEFRDGKPHRRLNLPQASNVAPPTQLHAIRMCVDESVGMFRERERALGVGSIASPFATRTDGISHANYQNLRAPKRVSFAFLVENLMK